MAVPLLDLKHQYKQIEAEVLPKIAELCESQEMILGPAVEQFEEEAGRYCGNVRTVGCSSGTDALLLALMALEIGPGDAVLTTPYTFFATAGCVRRLGIELLFADIDPLTYNISPQKIEETLSARCSKDSSGRLRTKNGNTLRAIIPVHLFGLCCDLDAIGEIAARHDLAVIEDAAQAIGAEYPSSKQTRTFRAGSYGAMGCFSFYPTKNLGAFGDAGLVTCLDPAHETRLRALRNHGMSERYFHHYIGGNFRLDALQAVVLSVKLPHLDSWSAARRRNAQWYAEAFDAANLTDRIQLPVEPYKASGLVNHHIYNQYVIRTPRRDELVAYLRESGIGAAIYYPLSLHLQPCMADLGGKEGDFPEAERASRETLALPIYPELSKAQIEEVVAAIAAFFA